MINSLWLTFFSMPLSVMNCAILLAVKTSNLPAALDSARDRDTIFVMPGEYREVVKVTKLRHLTLLGADPATTVIDAGGEYAAIELRTDSVVQDHLAQVLR